jgi:hypothetical protein
VTNHVRIVCPAIQLIVSSKDDSAEEEESSLVLSCDVDNLVSVLSFTEKRSDSSLSQSIKLSIGKMVINENESGSAQPVFYFCEQLDENTIFESPDLDVALKNNETADEKRCWNINLTTKPIKLCIQSKLLQFWTNWFKNALNFDFPSSSSSSLVNFSFETSSISLFYDIVSSCDSTGLIVSDYISFSRLSPNWLAFPDSPPNWTSPFGLNFHFQDIQVSYNSAAPSNNFINSKAVQVNLLRRNCDDVAAFPFLRLQENVSHPTSNFALILKFDKTLELTTIELIIGRAIIGKSNLSLELTLT